jgi:hypothetical protein
MDTWRPRLTVFRVRQGILGCEASLLDKGSQCPNWAQKIFKEHRPPHIQTATNDTEVPETLLQTSVARQRRTLLNPALCASLLHKAT